VHSGPAIATWRSRIERAAIGYYCSPVAATAFNDGGHAWIAVIGAVVFPIGISAVQLGGLRYEVLAIVGSLIVLTGMLLFAVIVFRNGAPQRA
jgi:hypothetical protein